MSRNMNRLRRLLFLLVSLIILSSLVPIASAGVLSPGKRAPAHWVPVSVAITKTGELHRALFTEADLAIIDVTRTTNATGCTTFMAAIPSEEHIDLESLDSLVANARTIVRGRITASEAGFYNGHPGTLYTLRPRPLLKHYGQLGAQSSLFLFIPEATIPTSQGYICARTFSDVPAPVAGDEVLAFVSLDPIDANQSVLEVDAQKQLVVVHEQRLFHSAAASVTRDEPKRAYATLDDLESAIRKNIHIDDLPKGGAQ